MNKPSFWYVRSGGEVRGPFPARTVADFLLLGRLTPNDEVSADKSEWSALKDRPNFVLEALRIDPADPQKEGKLKAAARRADERLLETPFAETHGGSPAERRQGTRAAPPHRPLPHEGKRRSVSTIPILAAIGGLILISLAAYLLQPEQPIVAGECLAPPGPGVNWVNCRVVNSDLNHRNLSQAKLQNVDFSGTNLTYARVVNSDLSYSMLPGADLRYADFSGSVLKGATLREAQAQAARFDHADLSHAVLEKANLMNASLMGADLRQANLAAANLSGARLTDARLDDAIWVDGTVCAKGSLGKCERP
ncbi:MAG: pentapeptide repeat-containing protein [Pseudomonadota bacterium]